MSIEIRIEDSEWIPIAGGGQEGEDTWARILYDGAVTINGVGFHLEGWRVEGDDWIEGLDPIGELASLHYAVGADGSWETVEVNGAQYVLCMSPYC